MALVVVPLVADHGVEYLFAAAILAGAIQIALGAMGIARLMRFVPQAVMTGFVNALAILIFLSQIDHLTGDGALGWVLVAAGLAIILILPRFLPAIPSPPVAIAILTTIVVAGGIDITNVGDEGELPSTIPLLGIPSVPFSLDTLTIIMPFSATLAAVGLLESLMTARLVDDITDTTSDKGHESRGQGIANVITGFFGGMPGCAMIGQTMINVRVALDPQLAPPKQSRPARSGRDLPPPSQALYDIPPEPPPTPSAVFDGGRRRVESLVDDG